MRRFNCLIIMILMPLVAVSQEVRCNDQWHFGEGTFYGGVAGGQGNCGLDVPVGDTMHVAMNHADYDSSYACGACLRVVGPRGTVHLRVVDRCPECKPGDLDMTPQAFFALAQERDGRIPLSWQYVPCPVTQSISIKFKIGSSAFWSAVQVRNSRYAIARFEYRHADGSYEEVPRTMYNFFLKESGLDDVKSYSPGPYQFRITSIGGQVLELPEVPFDTVHEVVTGVQFAELPCADCHGDTLGEALVDNCGTCSGGKTGIVPNSTCKQDCNGYWDGTAYTDGCGRCVAGTTGATPCGADCHGTLGGTAYIDKCGSCVGGKTNLLPCKKDCANVLSGSAAVDACGHCTGGTTGLPVCVAQRIYLAQGWNLFSVNVVPTEISPGSGRGTEINVSSLFNGLDVAEIKDMDVFWRAGQPGYLNTLKTIIPGNGYLVNMDSAETLTVTGMPIVVAQNPVQLRSGWQLVGCPYQTATPMAGVLGSSFAVVKDFGGFWMPNNGQSSFTVFEPGKGYFIQSAD